MIYGFLTAKILSDPKLIKKPYPDKGYWAIRAFSKINDANIVKKEKRAFDNYIIFVNESNPIVSGLRKGMVCVFSFKDDFHLSLQEYEKDGIEVVAPVAKFFSDYIFIVDVNASYGIKTNKQQGDNRNVVHNQSFPQPEMLKMAKGFLELGDYVEKKMKKDK
jgi:hypothetical protein